jgi:hypothetical protein
VYDVNPSETGGGFSASLSPKREVAVNKGRLAGRVPIPRSPSDTVYVSSLLSESGTRWSCKSVNVCSSFRCRKVCDRKQLSSYLGLGNIPPLSLGIEVQRRHILSHLTRAVRH